MPGPEDPVVNRNGGPFLRLDEPKTVMLIFRSGKIIITGAKTPGDANKAAA